MTNDKSFFCQPSMTPIIQAVHHHPSCLSSLPVLLRVVEIATVFPLERVSSLSAFRRLVWTLRVPCVVVELNCLPDAASRSEPCSHQAWSFRPSFDLLHPRSSARARVATHADAACTSPSCLPASSELSENLPSACPS